MIGNLNIMRVLFAILLAVLSVQPALAQPNTPAAVRLMPEGGRMDTLAEGFEWSEGPVWVGSQEYLLFSDIPKNTIYRWKEGEGLRIFMRPAGYSGDAPQGREVGTNAVLVDTSGAILAMDHGNRAVMLIDTTRFLRRAVVTRFEGKRLNSPNDAVFSRRGDLYFTDPPYGLTGLNYSPDKELPHNGVYRLSPDGRLELITASLSFPNGIGLSPDERTLYVANSDSRRPVWLAISLSESGAVVGERVLYDATDLAAQGLRGSPDGFAGDQKGRLIASGPGGILFISPDGELLDHVRTPQTASNVAFGGPDGSHLFITADGLLLRLPTITSGLSWAKDRN